MMKNENIAFGKEVRKAIKEVVTIMSKAVGTTLSPTGNNVGVLNIAQQPVIVNDGVTVSEAIKFNDPLKDYIAKVVRTSCKTTDGLVGDGTTTTMVLLEAIIKESFKSDLTPALLAKELMACERLCQSELESFKIEVTPEILRQVASISCNNDTELGDKIGQAYKKVGRDGVVLMEESDTNETYVEFVDGMQFDSPLKSSHLVTDKDKNTAVLDSPYVLIVSSPIPNIRRIQNVLEHVIKKKRSLLIVADVEQQPYQTLLANKVKGNIKVNIVDLPGFGPTKQETIEDLAVITGATVINEELGDDLEFITPDVLGEAAKAITDSKNTVLQIDHIVPDLQERIEKVRELLKEETNGFFRKKLEQRLSMLTGKVGVIRVGADSKIELKEKKDRVEDAIYATKAAYKEGIVPGGGVALLNAATLITAKSKGEEILFEAVKAPYQTILDNANLNSDLQSNRKGWGIDVTTGKPVNMIKAGIIDPVLVTKTALKNAVSVVNTIISADCIISNKRLA